MTKVSELLKELETLAPLVYQESYDNSGLIIGDNNAEIKGVLLSLDSTEAVIEEAITRNCNVVLCHHPIIFAGLKKITGANYVEKAIIKAIKHDIAIIAWHTNLDNIFNNGVNAKIAEKLGLINTKILVPKSATLLKLACYVPQESIEKVKQALFNVGCGAIGNYSECSFKTLGEGTFNGNEKSNPVLGEKGALERVQEYRLEVLMPINLQKTAIDALKLAHPYEEVAYDLIPIGNKNQNIGAGVIGYLPEPMTKKAFLNKLKLAFNLEVIKYTSSSKEMIEKVSVCGGVGSFLISASLAQNADAFVTADVKYHEFFDAENKLMICDIGHYESEVSTLEIFNKVLNEKFANFATLFANTKTNPVNYYI